MGATARRRHRLDRSEGVSGATGEDRLRRSYRCRAVQPGTLGDAARGSSGRRRGRDEEGIRAVGVGCLRCGVRLAEIPGVRTAAATLSSDRSLSARVAERIVSQTLDACHEKRSRFLCASSLLNAATAHESNRCAGESPNQSGEYAKVLRKYPAPTQKDDETERGSEKATAARFLDGEACEEGVFHQAVHESQNATSRASQQHYEGRVLAKEGEEDQAAEPKDNASPQCADDSFSERGTSASHSLAFTRGPSASGLVPHTALDERYFNTLNLNTRPNRKPISEVTSTIPGI